jgi:hypothetical protein
MKRSFLFEVFKSRYCAIVFAVSLFLSWFLIPKTMMNGFFYTTLAVLFMISFAMTVTCMVRNIKERILRARTYGTSFLGLIAIALGLSAVQVCGIGAPLCGATIGLGIATSIFPGFLFHFLVGWSVAIVISSILAQWLAIYFMDCFKKMPAQGIVDNEQ